MPTRTMTVNVGALMTEMANTCQSTGCTIGTKVVLGCLERIAKRACELNDPALLNELQTLMLIEEGSPQ